MTLPKTFGCLALLACVVLALGGPAAADDDKKDKAKPALAGAWAKKDGELKLDFRAKGVLKIFPHGDNEAVVVVCRYTVEKAGRVKAEVTDLEAKGDAKQHLQQLVPVGLKFHFKCQVKGDSATLGDVTGDKVEALKSHLEGDYERKK